jgi:hypothetical protein
MALDALNILEHQAQKFGVVTVIDATFFDLVTGEPILELDTLKMANIATEASEKEIRGGQQATQLVVYDYGRTASMEMQDALGSLGSMQYMWGSTLSEQNVTKHVKATAAVADDVATLNIPGGTTGGGEAFVGTYLTLSNASTSHAFLVLAAGGSAPAGVTKYAVQGAAGSEDDYALNGATLADGAYTAFYETAAVAGAQQLTLTSSSFSNNVKIVGKTFVIDQATGVRKAAELVIHNFQLNPTFELMFDSEGEASVFDFSGRALEDSQGRFITMKYLNENFA